MKIKILLTALLGAVTIQGAAAGDWCAPEPKCPIDCSPDFKGEITLGYDTDYIWKGVRWAGDNIWADVNYTFDCLPLSPTIGVWHLTSLGSAAGTAGAATGPGNDAYGDETNIYAGFDLPCLFGFENRFGYVLNLYPTARLPQGSPLNVGDSFQRLQFATSRDLFCGLTFNYLAEWYFGNDANPGVGTELDGWFHTLGLSKSFEINDCIALDLSAEASYNDGLYSGIGAIDPGAPGRAGGYGSGWNNYMLRAALPISLNCRSTLIPYIAYNGTPDGWVADHNRQISQITDNQGANANDVFFGGVSVKVEF